MSSPLRLTSGYRDSILSFHFILREERATPDACGVCMRLHPNTYSMVRFSAHMAANKVNSQAVAAEYTPSRAGSPCVPVHTARTRGVGSAGRVYALCTRAAGTRVYTSVCTYHSQMPFPMRAATNKRNACISHVTSFIYAV